MEVRLIYFYINYCNFMQIMSYCINGKTILYGILKPNIIIFKLLSYINFLYTLYVYLVQLTFPTPYLLSRRWQMQDFFLASKSEL